MSLIARNNGNGSSASTPVRYSRDPFQVARDLLSWDPFFGGRQASAFVPAFEVKETTEAFVVKADVPGVAEKDLDIAVHNNAIAGGYCTRALGRQEGWSPE